MLDLFSFFPSWEGKKLNKDNRMPPKILKEPIEVDNRLEELGLEREKLIEVVEAIVGARADCTSNDPPGSQGWSAYRMGTRRLREVLLPDEDWVKDEVDQIPCVTNAKLGVRIAVANTDDNTGIEGDHIRPQNISRKGSATDRLVHSNQGSFMDILDSSLNVVHINKSKQVKSPILFYYLCVYNVGEECRAELSCPSAIVNGYFTDYIERIILVGSDKGEGGFAFRKRRDGDGGAPEFDVSVTRKK
jgi:hypothetical protein